MSDRIKLPDQVWEIVALFRANPNLKIISPDDAWEQKIIPDYRSYEIIKQGEGMVVIDENAEQKFVDYLSMWKYGSFQYWMEQPPFTSPRRRW